MEARYPSIGEASPAEIFAAYKDLPQAPGGLDILKRIVQQNQNTGNMRGSIATSILNDAISTQPVPPMPQGTVSGNVVAKATPPAPMPMTDPNMLGLAAPGLEQMAQQHAATGGLIALAHGGPVQGYASKGEVGFSDPDTDWGDYMDYEPLPGADEATGLLPPTMYDLRGPRVGRGGIKSQDVLDQTDEALKADLVATRGRGAGPAAKTDSGSFITPEMFKQESSPWDLSSETRANPQSMPSMPGLPSLAARTSGGGASAAGGASPTVVVDTGDEGIPAAKPPEEKTTGGTSGRVPELSTEAQISSLAKFFGGDHSKAAELKGQMEKRLASKENKDLITDIATGLGAMFSGQGTKTQAAGAGLMAFAAQHGRSGEGHDRLQSTIDAMTLQDEAQRNAATQAAAQTVFGAQTKKALQEQGFLYDTYLHRLDNEAKIRAAAARAGGYDHFSRKQADIDQALSSAQQRAQNDKDWPTLSRGQQQARIENYLPPDLRGMLGGMTAGATSQSSYNLPPGYGYTPG